MSVYVIGSINQDIVVTADRHPNPGETIAGTDLEYFPGGKGGNQAVAAARAGAKARMVGMTGVDVSGTSLRTFLADSGVDVTSVGRSDEAPTGTALITVANAENTIIYVAGANALVTEDSLVGLVFERGDVTVAQYETPVATTISAFSRAKAAGATTVLNPAPAGPTPRGLLAVTDYLVVNEHEFSLVLEAAVADALADGANWADVVGDRFSGVLLLTLGADGVLVWSQEQRLRVPGREVAAVDSTGAGDCFVGYFAAGLEAGQDLQAAATRANVAAALSVTRKGAAASIPLAGEVSVE